MSAGDTARARPLGWRHPLLALVFALPLVMGALLWQMQRDQRAELQREEAEITSLRQARIDLSNGLLHAMLSGEPGSSFQRARGLALLDQALDTLARPHGPESAELQRAGLAFRAALDAWRAATPAARPRADAELRVAFHELERLAVAADLASAVELHALERQAERRFFCVILAGLSLIFAVITAGYVVGRRHGAALRALHDTRKRLRTISDNLPSAYVFRMRGRPDGTLRLVEASAGFERIHGLTEGEVVGDAARLAGQIDERDKAAYLEALGRSASLHGELTREIQIQRADHEARTLEVRARLTRHESGETEWDGLATDVTERKRTERALLESEARFRTLFEQAGDGILIVDQQRTYHEANERGLALLGLARAEVVGCAVGSLGGDRRDEALAAALDRLVPGASEICAWSLARGELTIDVELCARSLEDGRALVILRDTSERTRAALYAAAHQQITQALAETSTLDAGMPRVLGLICEILGWQAGVLWLREPPASALLAAAHWPLDGGPSMAALREPPAGPDDGLIDRALSARAPVFAAGLAGGARLAAARAAGLTDGIGCPISIRGEVVGILELFRRPAGEPGPKMTELLAALGVQIGQSIERQRLEAQFLQTQKLEAIGTLAGGIAHDFNNILTAIMSYASLAQGACEDPQTADDIEQILAAAQRAAALVRQILTFSRQQPPRVQATQIGAVLREVASLLRATLPASIQFVVRAPESLPTVQADATQLHQVLMNLGTNAWHAMRDRGGTLELTAEVRAIGDVSAPPGLAPGEHVVITVKDTGCGMDRETRLRIFEPFFTTKPVGEGTGLGLSVVHGIIHAHRGAITVESEPGAGSTFRVYLPTTEPGEGSLSSPSPGQQGRGQRLLIVDDEPAIVRSMSRILEQAGYRVTGHTDPAQALEHLRSAPDAYAAILTDLTLPGFDGLELARQARALCPRTPVLLATGHAAAFEREGLAVGIDALIQKPMRRDELLAAVARALAPAQSLVRMRARESA